MIDPKKASAVKIYNIERQTEKAVLMDDIWFPKSQIEVWEDDTCGTWAIMPGWLVKKAFGFIRFDVNFRERNASDFYKEVKSAKRII